jgi:hypothetical protein
VPGQIDVSIGSGETPHRLEGLVELAPEWRTCSIVRIIVVDCVEEVSLFLQKPAHVMGKLPSCGVHCAWLDVFDAEHEGSAEDEALPARAFDLPHLLSSLVHLCQGVPELPAASQGSQAGAWMNEPGQRSTIAIAMNYTPAASRAASPHNGMHESLAAHMKSEALAC